MMKDEDCNQERFYFIDKLVLELSEMQHQLADRDQIKADFEKEFTERKRIEEESLSIKNSLEEQLTNRDAEILKIKQELQREIDARKRVEEDAHTISASLEEQLSKQEAEKERIRKELQHEIQTWKRAVDNLQRSINEFHIFTDPDEKTQ
jgi:chromosome segregation ATPase